MKMPMMIGDPMTSEAKVELALSLGVWAEAVGLSTTTSPPEAVWV